MRPTDESGFQHMREVKTTKDIGKMYASYRQLVMGYLMRLCQNRELAEELTQETFCQVLGSMVIHLSEWPNR